MQLRPTNHSRGFTIIYGSIVIVAMFAMVSLSVDWGRVQTAKSELQDAADAASRYAVSGITDSSYLTKAQQAAAQNNVDGSSLTLTSADVDVGTWNYTTRAFAVSASNQNAVRVVGRRTAARGNAVPLVFARIIGRQNCDVTATSIATLDVLPYSMVALNSLSMSNASTIKRTAAEAAGGTVIVASNGAWSLGGTSSIAGDVLYRGTPPTGNITGNKDAMTANIAYPNVTAPGTAQYVGNINYSSGSYSVHDDYLVDGCTVSGTFTISLTADTNMYCTGNVSFGGNTQVITNGYKFTIYMTGASGTIAFTNNFPVNIVIYGPNATMTVNSTGKITGSFVAKSLVMTNGTIEYTSTLPIPILPTGGGSPSATGGVSTVK
ncbi:MAG: Endoglucanase [Phycisphaerales bacterium]|nr:Endoglucanase [Phycisphaerales bacterium]